MYREGAQFAKCHVMLPLAGLTTRQLDLFSVRAASISRLGCPGGLVEVGFLSPKAMRCCQRELLKELLPLWVDTAFELPLAKSSLGEARPVVA